MKKLLFLLPSFLYLFSSCNHTTGTLNGHDWVDLGLSVKWATCNIGANCPSDYGGYYAWAENLTKPRYDWSNCLDCKDRNNTEKDSSWLVFRIGAKTSIARDSACDAAYSNWGGPWRMPTDEEFNELCKKCTWEWTSQNGHNGYLVTGPNGNNIFLPAAGYRCEGFMAKGSCGSYWSSSLSSSISRRANNLRFRENGDYDLTSQQRCAGQSIRPVTE